MTAKTLREAAQMAQAHIRWREFGECRSPGWDGPPPTAAETDAVLVQALALPDKPVAYCIPLNLLRSADTNFSFYKTKTYPVPLYAVPLAPAECKPLSQEVVWKLWKESVDKAVRPGQVAALLFARAIERAHGTIS